MPRSLEGAVALVTGATGGIGSATCAALSEAGATVVATDLELALNKTALRAEIGIDLDVTDEAAWKRVIHQVKRQFERLDILVNNAGISLVGRIEDMPIEVWRRCQAVNVEGTFLGIKSSALLLAQSGERRAGGSSVINLSSVAGLRGAAFNAAYCASKGAVRLLTKSAALEFSALKYPIRVNSVHPGGVDTEMMDSIMDRYVEIGALDSSEEGHAMSLALHPIGRMARPEEIAAGIAFLASDDASYMHGSEMVIDGAFTAR